MNLGMITHTSMVELMELKIMRFVELYAATGRVLEKRNGNNE